MKNLKSTTFILTTLSLALCLSFVQADKWVLVHSKKYNYKIEFPKKPKEQTQSLDSELGKLQLNMFVYDASEVKGEDNLYYLCNCTEYPGTAVSSANKEALEGFYRGGIDGAVKNVKGKLLTEKTITIDGYEGREATIDYQEGLAVITMRMLLVENRMYLVQTITETSKLPNESVSKFMESFQLSK
ncbi:MAG TPA: hypothetical protein VK750_06390 [Cytophagaceae bacterium]|jgi:hypothetical protein|nr:hypothetical protein [Cytophagaceae bacterium]